MKELSGTASLDEFVARLTPPRVVWVMVPAAVVDRTLGDLAARLQQDDIVIDGGNSYYIDDIRRAEELNAKGIHYLDVGTSGGIWGLERGYCLMIGGPEQAVRHLDPIFKTLAPGRTQIARTAGKEKAEWDGGRRVFALWPCWRRAFRQDGAQRHRVWLDGRVRGRIQHLTPC